MHYKWKLFSKCQHSSVDVGNKLLVILIMRKFYISSNLKNRKVNLKNVTIHRSTPRKRMDGDETRWRPPSILFIPLILCGCLIFFVDVFQLQSFKIPTTIPLPQPRLAISEELNLKGFLIKTSGCRIPHMDPFDPSVEEYIFTEYPVICNNDTPPLMESNLTSIYILKNSLPAYGISDISALKCCYSVFKRAIPKKKESDNKVTFNTKCIEFNQTRTISDEYIRVICLYNGTEIYRDFFSFVPIKSEMKQKSIRKNKPLNVLVIGLDAVSRLNLHRQMPKTVQILKELNAIELMGYNKVGDNTYPNLVPVLTGLTEDELAKTCWRTKRSRFDDCPFVWKNYRSEGFTTAFGEDSAWMGIFNYLKRGFSNPPTDYYWGPYNHIMEQQIGNEHRMNVFQCVGSRLVYNTLLEYIDKFIKTMHINKIPFFGFFWGASLSHDYLNKPKLGDEDYTTFLSNLKSNKILDDTVLIFMSDHGIRWGGIRTTYQGRMEERLPFLFILLPEKYRETCYHSYINLRKNIRRLTTPFDLHETLKDLINPYALTGEALNSRFQQRDIRRGYSLFEPIPANRTCDEAGIESHWCTCQQSTDVNKSDIIVVKAAEFTVHHINNQLIGYADCANLSLAEIFNARLHSSGNNVLVGHTYSRDYTIAFRTIPGDAVFEATVRQHFTSNKNKTYGFSITGTISRINLYGRQSLCMTDFHLKLYCYCKT